MIHALILADIEGVVGIYNSSDIMNSGEIFTQEVELCIQILLENGVDKITVCDAHNEGNMVDLRITKTNCGGEGKVRLVSQTPQVSFDIKYDFAVMTGYHGMEGSFGIWPHTYRYDIKEISVADKISGKNIPIGEVEIDARWLGSQGVPVILVTGDREATYEANCFNPYRQACCVKSYFQSRVVDDIFVRKKLSDNIKLALGLNSEYCLSKDDDEIAVEFYNPDTADSLGTMGYNSKGGKIIFDSCEAFVNELHILANHLNCISEETLKVNKAFLKDVRELVKTLSKEDVAQSEIGPLLNNNLLFLDRASRDKVMVVIKDMLSNL